MAITIAINEASPAGADNFSDGDDTIRATRKGVRERMVNGGHYWPDNSTDAKSGIPTTGPNNHVPYEVTIYDDTAGVPDLTKKLLKVTGVTHADGRGTDISNGFLRKGGVDVAIGTKRHVFHFQGQASGSPAIQVSLANLVVPIPQHFTAIVMKEFIIIKNTLAINTQCTFQINKITPTWTANATTGDPQIGGTALLSAALTVASTTQTGARSTSFNAVTLLGGDLLGIVLSVQGTTPAFYAAALAIEYV